ncbi:MAG: 50S ribosomal protein L11 methyltransferase [Clostridiales bacterium]|nr:50S ribosomal protein L11 methyltransferase [Clostridiales bacterium]
MDWTKLSIFTTSEGIDSITGIMLANDVGGFEIEDAKDFNEFLTNQNARFDYIDDSLNHYKTRETCVSCYLANNEQGKKQGEEIKKQIALLLKDDKEHILGRLQVQTVTVREEDWADNWKQYFKPFSVGNRLLIKPSWENCEHPDGRKILEIDPGSSFGTGQHETTKLCLMILDELILGGERILDLGCGSGILSIGALLLGASSALGVDIEENAVAVAQKNALQNGFGQNKFSAFFGNLTRDESLCGKIGSGYDIITANIVADVLIDMAPYFGQFLKKDGTLIVSGIIEERANEVTEALNKNGFSIQDIKKESGWVAVRLT